jgi:hypothetical protein
VELKTYTSRVSYYDPDKEKMVTFTA